MTSSDARTHARAGAGPLGVGPDPAAEAVDGEYRQAGELPPRAETLLERLETA
jgi:hypothetical protein